MELKYWNRVMLPAKEVSMLILDSNKTFFRSHHTLFWS